MGSVIAARDRAGIASEIITVKVTGYWRDRSRRGIGPDICLQIRMVDVDALVNHSYHDAGAAGRSVPGRRRADFAQPVKTSKAGIIRSQVGMHNVVRFGVQNICLFIKSSDCRQRIFGSNPRYPQTRYQIRSFEAFNLNRNRAPFNRERGRGSLLTLRDGVSAVANENLTGNIFTATGLCSGVRGCLFDSRARAWR